VPPKAKLALVPAAALHRPVEIVGSDPDHSLYAGGDADLAIQGMLEGIGGQQGLINELLLTPDLPYPIQALVQFSFDPRFKGKPFGWLCAKAGITPGDVFMAFRDAMQARATIQTMRMASQALVPVLAAIVQDAQPHAEVCEHCQGQKVITKIIENTPKRVRCPKCNGVGAIQVKGERDAQKLVLELVGLTQKQAQNQINVNQTTQVQANQYGGGDDPLSPASIRAGLPQMQQALSQILFKRESVAPPAVVDSPEVEAHSPADPPLCDPPGA
jgi:hypothetical protein